MNHANISRLGQFKTTRRPLVICVGEDKIGQIKKVLFEDNRVLKHCIKTAKYLNFRI